MNFVDMFNQVVVATARPDLINETITELQKQTLRMHHLNFWQKDYVERVIPIPGNPSQNYFTYQIDIRQNMPGLRRLNYIRKWDTVGLAPGQFFGKLDPSAALDSYALNKNNKVYLAGSTLNVVSTTADLAVLVGYYKHPVINPLAAYSSWIAEEYPYAITDAATQTVFTMIGKMDEAALYGKKVSNPGDAMNPGWIEQLWQNNLETGPEGNGTDGNSFFNYVGNPWLSS